MAPKASLAASRHLTWAWAWALAVLPLLGCFAQPDDKVAQMVCTADKNCPNGYECDKSSGASTGKCVRSGSGQSATGGMGGSAGRLATGGPSGDAAADPWQSGGGGGTPSAGGSQGSGGMVVRPDGQAASGGLLLMGGARGGGGLVSSGGVAATGGNIEADAAIDVPTGGVLGTGGVVGSGGRGGVPSTGGSIATECSPGTHSCSDNSLLTCGGDGRWPATGSRCTYVCRNNACTGVCNTGDRSCTGDTLLTCDANGNWPTTGSACTYVCRNNACTGQCKTTQTACSGDTLLTCDANGNWPTTGSACTYVCRNNACTGQCKPSQATCNGNTLYLCDSNGNWPATGTACGAGYVCDSASTPPTCRCNLTLCSDGRCLDTSADPMNCGACDRACPGQCAGGACKCATQSPSNLVVNGGFDSSAASWSPETNLTVAFSTLDASNCASSGSLLVTYTGVLDSTSTPYGKCMVVSPSTTYNMGGWVYSPSGHDRCSGSISVDWYSGSACGSLISPGSVFVNASERCDVWQYLHKESVVPPSGATGAMIYPWVDRVTTGVPQAEAYYDSLYLTPAPGRF